MRKLLKKIIEILDGTPAVYGKQQRGQSVLEMAFITPLLIILIAGVVEIGWLANNYLILQEVTRIGARRGTVLRDNYSPMAWNSTDGSSLVPGPAHGLNNWKPDGTAYSASEKASRETAGALARNCNASATTIGFYTLIACTMEQSMAPLSLDTKNNIDDIVISVFAVHLVNNTPTAPTDADDPKVNITPGNFPGLTGPIGTAGSYPTGYHVYVVGRYPTDANECTSNSDPSLAAPPGVLSPLPERDPFDWIHDGVPSCIPGTCGTPNPAYLEISGFQYPSTRQWQRGFVWTGQHKVERDDFNTTDVFCYGSQWTIKRFEGLMNLVDPATGSKDFHDYTLPGNTSTESWLPKTEGVVLVEIWWKHTLLLRDFPVFSPVYNALGNTTRLYTWAAFPVPAANPEIKFKAS